MITRTNRPLEMLIDLAIILLPEIGVAEAARMLYRHQVPVELTRRVLTRARKRRPIAELAR